MSAFNEKAFSSKAFFAASREWTRDDPAGGIWQADATPVDVWIVTSDVLPADATVPLPE